MSLFFQLHPGLEDTWYEWAHPGCYENLILRQKNSKKKKKVFPLNKLFPPGASGFVTHCLDYMKLWGKQGLKDLESIEMDIFPYEIAEVWMWTIIFA